jgi:hypothetical protein
MQLAKDVHSIRIMGGVPPPRSYQTPEEVPLDNVAGPLGKPEAKSDATLAQAAPRQRAGGLRLASPIELKVLEGDRILGSTADGPIITTAGVHELELINGALGFRTHLTTTIRAGQITSVSIAPPEGKLSINASPWAQVLIDGNAAGETPLANVSVAAGEHEIIFRHPQLGERRETVVVRSGALTRVSATLGR